MSDSPDNLIKSSTEESDNQIIDKIRPKVTLLLGLLLGILGNFFVSAIFVGIDISTLDSNAKRNIVVLGLVSGVFVVLLLINDLYPDLNRIKEYPKQSKSSKYIFYAFITILILIIMYGMLFNPPTREFRQDQFTSCQNVTYVVNYYTYNQNYTIEQIKIEKTDSSVSVQELQYLINRKSSINSK